MIVKKTAAAERALNTAVSGTEIDDMWASTVMMDMRTLHLVSTWLKGRILKILHYQGLNVGEFQIQVQFYCKPEAERKCCVYCEKDL